MLICNVSLRPPRRAIAAELAELAAALDAPGTGNVVFATLVDDPASVGEIVDAYLGEIMLEAASAADAADASIPATYAAAVNEAVTANDSTDASFAPLTTWNPADISTYGGSSWPTFSNGNLSIQTSAGNNQAVRSTKKVTSGKVYFECVWNPLVSGPHIVGITDGATLMNNVALSLSNEIGYSTSGIFYLNGGTTGSVDVATAGQTVCVAVDLTNSRFWARVNNGNWNGSSSNNPATNVGGISFSSVTLTGGAYAFSMLYFTPSKVTANFGALAFTQSIPSGFTSWDAVAV